MPDFPGFPCNGFDFHYEEVGPALAGLIVRDVNGAPRAGLLPSRPDLVRTRADWFLDTSPFVAVRVRDGGVLLGGTTDNGQLQITPAPSVNSRLDVVWTRPANIDAGEENLALQVTTGTPAAVPSKPAIPAGAIEVGTLLLPPGASRTNAGTWTPTFPTTVTAGGVIPFRSVAERNAFAGVPGQLGMLNGYLYRRDAGGTWIPLEPIAGRATAPSLPAATATEVQITFPTGMFPSAPRLLPVLNVPVAWNPPPRVRALSITATGATLQLYSSDARTGVAIDWTAMMGV